MKIIRILTGASLAVLAAGLVGCSAHEDAPRTPYIIATTPTYRATANSTDPVIEPYYMTPGVNGGQRVKAPSVASPDRYNANNPLAVAVYVALSHAPDIDVHYVTVEGKPNAVLLQGTVRTAAQKATIERIARQTPGVKSIQNSIAVLKS